jgi:hypothetical protein
MIGGGEFYYRSGGVRYDRGKIKTQFSEKKIIKNF